MLADFEGGIRVAAFVGGGFLPVHNTSRDGYIHAADWYPTVCLLAGGHDCREMAASSAASVPAVDGVRTTLSLPPPVLVHMLMLVLTLVLVLVLVLVLTLVLAHCLRLTSLLRGH